MKKLLFLLLIIATISCNKSKYVITNQLVGIKTPLSQNTLFSLTQLQTGESVNFKAPTIEVDGKPLCLMPNNLIPIGICDTLKNGVLEYKLQGPLLADPSISLQVAFRLAPNSPVVRFCYTLSSNTNHTLTKSNGADSLLYFAANFENFNNFSEIRLSDFNEQFHSFNLIDQKIDHRYFENNLQVTGPIFVAENSQTSFLLAYEHGSQIPDRFIEYNLQPNKNIALKAVKGNYYNGQALNAQKTYQTIWLQVATVKGNKQTLAKQYRNFVLNYLSVNNSSRTPYVYYNTWGFQERNKCWNGQKYLTSMNLTHSLAEIEKAHLMGIDVYVLDAGWFGKTGDWRVNTTFFPDTLKTIKAKLDEYNMHLGLWYSPTQAAVTSSVYKQNEKCISSYNDKKSDAWPVWETEASYNMCIVSSYWKDCAAEMIRNAQEYGNIYFKWDAIYQYGCNSANHNHGTNANSLQERTDCYAFELGKYMNKIVDSVTQVVPNAIVDFDVTEGWRSMGLQFLASGKYFLINNGPYYGNYDLPQPDNMLWNNVFVQPGPTRARVCRYPLSYDQWIPSILFLTHYLPDAPQSSQITNIASLVLGQNGFWGNIADLSNADANFIGSLIGKYKQVKTDITVSYPVATGNVGTLPEIHEKINEATGKGVVAIFSVPAAGHKFTYVTQNKVDTANWHNNDVTVTFDPKGRAIITAEFKTDDAKIIFFGVK